MNDSEAVTETSGSKSELDPSWARLYKDRSCGECFACCVWLGITELRKYTGQSCKHLSGRIADKRCQIYDERPHACQIYKCGWLQGLGGDELRPDKCGMLMTPYASETNPDVGAVTLIVFDIDKAKDKIAFITKQLLVLGVTELRVIDPQTQIGMFYRNGEIYECQLQNPQKGDYESLVFIAGKKVGTFRIEDKD